MHIHQVGPADRARISLMRSQDVIRRMFLARRSATMLTEETKVKLWELAAASPLILWFTLGIIGSAVKLWEVDDEATPVLGMCTRIATIALLALVIRFLIIRHPVVKKVNGVSPRLAAVAALCLPSLLALLPQADMSPLAAGLSSGLALLGLIASIVTIQFLGRSFSVMPQARKMVTEGPYRIVRHPLYLAELVVTLGVMWRFEQPWPLIILAVTIGVQLLRIRFEERILLETFPGYREYAERTARLVPGFY